MLYGCGQPICWLQMVGCRQPICWLQKIRLMLFVQLSYKVTGWLVGLFSIDDIDSVNTMSYTKYKVTWMRATDVLFACYRYGVVCSVSSSD